MKGTCFLRTDRDEDRQNVIKREIQGVEGERRRETVHDYPQREEERTVHDYPQREGERTVHDYPHPQRKRENRDNQNFWFPWQKVHILPSLSTKSLSPNTRCMPQRFILIHHASLALCQLRSKESASKLLAAFMPCPGHAQSSGGLGLNGATYFPGHFRLKLRGEKEFLLNTATGAWWQFARGKKQD